MHVIVENNNNKNCFNWLPTNFNKKRFNFPTNKHKCTTFVWNQGPIFIFLILLYNFNIRFQLFNNRIANNDTNNDDNSLTELLCLIALMHSWYNYSKFVWMKDHDIYSTIIVNWIECFSELHCIYLTLSDNFEINKFLLTNN